MILALLGLLFSFLFSLFFFRSAEGDRRRGRGHLGARPRRNPRAVPHHGGVRGRESTRPNGREPPQLERTSCDARTTQAGIILESFFQQECGPRDPPPGPPTHPLLLWDPLYISYVRAFSSSFCSSRLSIIGDYGRSFVSPSQTWRPSPARSWWRSATSGSVGSGASTPSARRTGNRRSLQRLRPRSRGGWWEC